MAGFFGMFDYTKPGKGVSKEELDKHGIALFFDILARRIWKILLLNIIYVIASIPAIFVSWAASAFVIVLMQSVTGVDMAIQGIEVLHLFFTAIIFTITGSGSASAAMSYVLRKYVNDTHSWVWSDFVDQFKVNFRQGLCAYVINIVVTVLISTSLLFYTFSMRGTAALVLRTVVIIMGAVFLLMQMYVYQIMATVKLKIKDIYRNALLLTLGKLPVNIIAYAFLLASIYGLNLIISSPISILVLFVCFFSVNTFIQIFITNNTVNKYIVAPSEQVQEEKTENPEG